MFQFGFQHHHRPQSLFLHPSAIMEEDDDAIECDDDFPSSSVPAMSSDSLKESSGNMTSDSLNEMQLLAKFKSATDSQDTYKVC